MFSELIKADDMEDSFEVLGIKKSSEPCLQVKELDPELLGVIPGGNFVNKTDKSLTAIESRLLRAATPALSLWSEIQAAWGGGWGWGWGWWDSVLHIKLEDSDSWISDVVQGKAISWVSVPQQDKTPQPLNFNKLVSTKIDTKKYKKWKIW